MPAASTSRQVWLRRIFSCGLQVLYCYGVSDFADSRVKLLPYIFNGLLAMEERNKEHVGIGLSGGTDSAAAGYRLVSEGYKVTGFTMILSAHGEEVARKGAEVARRLGIEHVVIDLREAFERLVLKRFADEYACGLTPSPCVVCNSSFKFGAMWEAMSAHGCTRLATGHYVEVRHGGDGEAELWRGTDRSKDQSYFLAQLRPEQLSRSLFPLGTCQKREVAEMVRELGLIPRSEGESQDLCFLPDGNYADFVLERKPWLDREGVIVEYGTGRVLGTHRGAFRYTEGQRRGLGLGGGPWFVHDTDIARNVVTIAHAEDMGCSMALLRGMNWLDKEPAVGEGIEASVQVRHQMRPRCGRFVNLGDGCARLELSEPVQAIPPGQLAVGYSGDRVLGSGWICRPDAMEVQ